METASLKQRLMVGCGPQWTYRRMLYSGLLLLQLRISGPCLCLEESMEEQDEKPQGSLKACVQVSAFPQEKDKKMMKFQPASEERMQTGSRAPRQSEAPELCP
ncbi:hypothetical protein E5288_WYG016533 [Bos mutus]|uniref:Uncharacterized protein n=1 Tax=Bos mutus TaxID=72004 RepID=A0A6B0S581_9CETA|nr:hypothetical protein [Bos mutus]